MPRALWKGAISFGLVHIPVGLYPATRRSAPDFDWLDKRSMAPVGYKRINKQTGREVARENIVKGLQYEKGKYVVLSDEEIRSARNNSVKSVQPGHSSQTVDIVAFVDAHELQPACFEVPYFLAPAMRGEKVYALLRETLRRENKVGIAYVVIQTKRHLAALIPGERVLMLNTLRWPGEMRSADELDLPAAGTKQAGLRDKELDMAAQLVKDMTEKWDPGKYHDSFREDILAMARRKARTGKVESVADAPEGERPSAKVIDLTELLRQSLRDSKASGHKAPSRAAHSRTSHGAKAPARARATPHARPRAAAHRRRAAA